MGNIPGIPRNIEVLIKKGSVDPDFYAKLTSERSASAEYIGLDLTASEKLILDQIPEIQLQRIVSTAKVPEEHRCIFRSKVAAFMLFALGVIPFSAIADEAILKDSKKTQNAKTAEKSDVEKENEMLLKQIEILKEQNQVLKNDKEHLEKVISKLRASEEDLKQKLTSFGNRPTMKDVERYELWELQAKYFPELKGKILKVNEKWGFVIIDLGRNNIIKVKEDGKEKEIKVPIKESLLMLVKRNEKLIGKLVVKEMNDKHSTCNIIFMAEDEKIQEGDIVTISKKQY